MIWPLFSIAKAKKPSCFCFFWMTANLSQNLALKLAPNDNYFTEKLLGILWTEFKLFISNWKRFDPYFPLLRTKKNRLDFYFLSAKTWKHNSQSQSKGHEVHWRTVRYLMNWIQVVYFKLKETCPYFPLLKTKNRARFLLPYLWMKAWNLCKTEQLEFSS